MQTTKRKVRGVTLLELLVVLAIITMLMAVMLPALSPTRGEGAKAQCLNNLREIMGVAMIYAVDDPQTIIGPVHPKAYIFSGEGYAEYGGGPGTLDFMGWDDEFDPRTRPFNHIIYGENGVVANTAPGDISHFQVYRCPGNDRGWQEWPGFGTDPRETENSYFEGNGTSFRMNNLYFTGGQQLGIYGWPSTRIPQPGLTLAFMEARVYQTLWTNDTWGFLDSGELISYHDRLGYFDVAYADGHVSFVDFGDGTYYEHMDWPDYPQFQGCDVRGTWGRMDCLPEPLFDPG
ncbi:MAG: prepilin-type N-terminal cleavage/methylation domain-containing protein [Phycisphaerae bacterium]|nr:prepilin-type N-terminal cleavage/methylation domain-containing protein [Phycisphaerae bacterium]